MKDMIDSLPGAFKLKMPGFVIAWSIVDIVLVSIRLLELPFLIISLFFCSGNIILSILVMEIVTVLIQGGFGLSGNILMLCKRHPALGLCRGSTVLTLASFAVLIWQLIIFRPMVSPVVYIIVASGVVLFIMMRITLLVFYLISLHKAAAFFRERDGF